MKVTQQGAGAGWPKRRIMQQLAVALRTPGVLRAADYQSMSQPASQPAFGCSSTLPDEPKICQQHRRHGPDLRQGPRVLRVYKIIGSIGFFGPALYYYHYYWCIYICTAICWLGHGSLSELLACRVVSLCRTSDTVHGLVVMH